MSAGRQITAWRSVLILAGDSIQTIALRETGDVGNWIAIADLNGVRHPYIVASRQGLAADARVLAYGETIRIPGHAQVLESKVVLDTEAFGTDVALTGGRFTASDGDLTQAAGVPNIAQAIRHRILTEPGELRRHPRYGCELRALLGERNTGVTSLLAHAFTVEALGQEPRIDHVERADVLAEGDRMRIEVVAHTFNGAVPVSTNLVVGSI